MTTHVTVFMTASIAVSTTVTELRIDTFLHLISCTNPDKTTVVVFTVGLIFSIYACDTFLYKKFVFLWCRGLVKWETTSFDLCHFSREGAVCCLER